MRCCFMIRKLASGKYRLYSRKKNPQTGKRRNSFGSHGRRLRLARLPAAPGTFDTRKAAEKHEREIQYFKRH